MSAEQRQIITAAGPNMAGIMEHYSLPTMERYANIWGYSVKAESIDSDNSVYESSEARAARWHKVSAIRRALQTNDTVVWFDADVMIMRDDEDIASHIAPDSFQGLAIENVPAENRVNPNTGVWVMRNSPQAFDFLDKVEELGMPSNGKWADQGAVMKVLGWKLGDVEDHYRWAGPGLGSRFIEGTSWLPTSWNQPYLKRQTNAEACVDRPAVANPHAVHFMGMSVVEREDVMRHFLLQTTEV
jgi:hypothetical protein